MKAKRDEHLRYESFLSPEEEAELLKERESAILTKPLPVGRRGKRSVEDVMASMPNDLSQSIYAMERIAAAEDTIAKVLGLCTEGARELIIKQRPSLGRYYNPDD